MNKIYITADDNIKHGKSFDTYITVKSDEPFGAVNICLEYDNNFLEFSSASLEEKHNGDFFKYKVLNGGKISYIFMSKESQREKTVKIRFKQLSYDINEYSFYAYPIEAYSDNKNKIDSISPSEVKVEVTQTTESSTSVIEKSKQPISDTDKSFTENSKKVPAKLETDSSRNMESDGTDSEVQVPLDEQSSGTNEYDITTHNDPLSKSSPNYNALIGAAAAVAIGIFVCIKQYRKLKK